jgi:hypothetical protein
MHDTTVPPRRKTAAATVSYDGCNNGLEFLRGTELRAEDVGDADLHVAMGTTMRSPPVQLCVRRDSSC